MWFDMGMDSFSVEWVRDRLREKGLKQRQLGEHLGLDQDKISKSLSGVRRFTADEALAIKEFLGGDTSDDPELVFEGDEAPNGKRLVAVYDVSASAGGGAIADAEDLAAYSLAFPPNYLKKLTRSNAQNLSIISVKGDSMFPTLLDDDLVMLDVSKRDLNYDGLFVLRYGENLLVKRIARSARREHIKIISDNRDLYPPEDVHVGEVEVVGKVIWKGGKV